jgi:exopolyphosphatase/guanosine-5'-triphosphate,3'-diphosphate pyrophosphatase
MDRPNEPLTVAAVDLGSNSFHLIIARFLDHELQVIDRVREQVMLADGLDADDRLTEAAQDRALACLERIGERLRSIPSVRVRAVGTNTLRRAKSAGRFRARCQAALGHPIEIVSGQEEARLIYLGVAQDQFSTETRLLADIGGGSTEILLGKGYEVLRAHSLFMGCVDYSKRFFADGVLRKDRFRKAEIAAGLELRAIQHELRRMGWERCLGSSGTINAVREVVRAAGWTDSAITWPAIKKLRRAMIDAETVDRLRFQGLKAERAPVLAGGLAILRAIFRSLEIDAMHVASGAMREGVLHDLVGRIRHDDIRDHTIRRMVERYHVDLGQSIRVEQVALRLLDQLGTDWGMDAYPIRKQLVWASHLHEIGLAVSHTGFHKHGAYLIEHSHMPGFSSDDQAILAALVGGQRRKLSRTLFAGLASDIAEPVARLCVVFRLAILLNRSRRPQTTPAIEVSEDWSELELAFPDGWCEAHPLTQADLEQEAHYLAGLGVELQVVEIVEPGPAPEAPDAVSATKKGRHER